MQKSISPLITIAMPIYNAGSDIRLAVLSIINQTQLNWELLIIDDGSTDNALSYISDIEDVRVRILRDGLNRGLAARLNEAIDLANGIYFARMDQDDISYPERLKRQTEVLKSDPQLDLVAVRALTIDENNEPNGIFPSYILHEEICSEPWRGFYLPHPTWMGKIEWFRKHRYAEPGPFFCEDQELLTRSYRESKFFTINEILFAYRIRAGVNRYKLLKTRRAVLGIQSKIFYSSRQYHFLLYASLVFLGRMIYDFLKVMPMMKCKIRNISHNDDSVIEWRKIFFELMNTSEEFKDL